MKRLVIAVATCAAVAAPAIAAPRQIPGSIVVAQVATGATGGVSGGPEQRQAVPAGVTGGVSGGPEQRQAVPAGATGGVSGGPKQRQAVPAGATGGKSGGPEQRRATRPMKHKKIKE